MSTWQECRFTYRALTKGRYGDFLGASFGGADEAAVGSSRTRNDASLTLELQTVVHGWPRWSFTRVAGAIDGQRDTVFPIRLACLSVSSNFQCCGGGRSTDPKATSS
jgi:hypothetical protein